MARYHLKSFEDYLEARSESIDRTEEFWASIASYFEWQKPWERVLESDFERGHNRWFEGGLSNITANCLDRHLAERGNKLALIWEPNDPRERFVRLTFRDLHTQVCRMANVLKKHGIGKGDRVAIYMPMIPELAVSVLACARIGAVHSVVFAGFSAQSLADRVQDAGAKAVLCSDGLYRGNKEIPVKRVVDEALEHCPTVERVLVVERTNWAVHMQQGRDFWVHSELETVEKDCPAEAMDSEDPLFILYTSGSTGKPKGVVHSCAGYMVYAGYTFRNVFQCLESDIFWCTADLGWITGHSYLLYGPLLNGTTSLMFEGVPTHPDPGRFWQVCDKHGVNVFYTAPTAIRALMAAGEDHVLAYSLDSLRLLGTVGEPINEEAWHWYHIHVGKERCAIVDTWWQTETGGIMISGLAALSPMKPAHAGLPLPGVEAVLLDKEGGEITETEAEGLLCIKKPWPGMIRTTYGDHERCVQTYFSAFKGYYFTGDGAKRTADGLFRIIGRVDDVINVSGHRFGTAEIENAINLCKAVAESAVVGYPHPIKGQGIHAYVVLREGSADLEIVHAEIVEAVVEAIGRIAKPDRIQFSPGLPKTRSGKIMRRILRKIAEGETESFGDVSTLLDPDIVPVLLEGYSKF